MTCMNDTPRGETAQRRRDSADATSGQRHIRRVQIQLSLLRIIETTHKPLGEVQLSEIAAGVGSDGISPSNVYTYYATKEDILRDAVEARLTERMSKIDLHFRRSETFADYTTRLIDAMLDLWTNDAAILNAAAGLSAAGDTYHRWWQTQLNPWAHALRTAVDEARTTGELPDIPGHSGMLANVAIWSLQSSCQQVITHNPPPDHHNLLRESLTLTLRRLFGEQC